MRCLVDSKNVSAVSTTKFLSPLITIPILQSTQSAAYAPKLGSNPPIDAGVLDYAAMLPVLPVAVAAINRDLGIPDILFFAENPLAVILDLDTDVHMERSRRDFLFHKVEARQEL
jgi:hypothetical protein